MRRIGIHFSARFIEKSFVFEIVPQSLIVRAEQTYIPDTGQSENMNIVRRAFGQFADCGALGFDKCAGNSACTACSVQCQQDAKNVSIFLVFLGEFAAIY